MIYFDNAATSKFKPLIMAKEILKTIYNSSNFSRASHKDALYLATEIALFRQDLLSYFNVLNTHEIIFTASCTDGLNMAILGYASNFKKPFHIISTAFDHNSSLRPIEHLRLTKKAYYTIIYPDNNLEINIDNIEKSITPNTKLLVLNHMSNVTGSYLNISKIKEISKKYSIPVVLDIAQSAGHLNFSLDGIAAASIAPHKGFHSPQGLGCLIIDKNFNLSPIKFGGSGINSESLSQPNIMPDGYEVGTINAPGIIGFKSGFKYTIENLDKIHSKIDNLSLRLHHKLQSLKNFEIFSYKNSPIISIKHKYFPSSKVSEFLDSKDIATRSGLHCAPIIHSYLGTIKQGLTRISIGYNNSENDIDYLMDMLTFLDNLKQ